MDSSGSFVEIGTADAMHPALCDGVVAIGNFDGVHKGHQAVLGAAMARAASLGRPSVALTFEPHPRQFFQPEKPLFRLSHASGKMRLMRAFGLDGVVVRAFDAALSAMSAGDFVTHILRAQMRVHHVVTGHDFHFGAARAGTPAFLQEQGRIKGFGVTIVDALASENGEVVSSSRIRDALRAGDIAGARNLLGHGWFVRGTVISGERRGRTLGYPTANLRLDPACGLAHGIYAVQIRHAGRIYGGVASFGRRPTFDNGAPLLEVFIFDFSASLYGEVLDIAFISFIRKELRFENARALVCRMDQDAAMARDSLRDLPPATRLDQAFLCL